MQDLGRKARERLKEEKRKRREIVWLESEQDAPSTEKTKDKPGAAFSKAIRKQVKHTTTPAKRKHISPKKYPSGDADQNVDTWVPDTSHVSLYSDADRSNVLRLHGLPQGVKPDLIRLFFASTRIEYLSSSATTDGFGSGMNRTILTSRL